VRNLRGEKSHSFISIYLSICFPCLLSRRASIAQSCNVNVVGRFRKRRCNSVRQNVSLDLNYRSDDKKGANRKERRNGSRKRRCCSGGGALLLNGALCRVRVVRRGINFAFLGFYRSRGRIEFAYLSRKEREKAGNEKKKDIYTCDLPRYLKSRMHFFFRPIR
jgi:hypothetical protein